MEWIEFPSEKFKVHGLPWFEEQKPSISRLPVRMKDSFNEWVWLLAQCPAGARIRFRTDARRVGVRATCPNGAVMYHITHIGQSGFDIYVDGRYAASACPNDKGETNAEWTIGSDRRMRDVTIHLPTYETTSISHVGLEDGASMESATPFAVSKPVVFYGTSITQGGCASNPGATYQDFLSRWLNVDYVNLGFSGSGKGETELARAINEIDASCIVLDHWANVLEGLKENLPLFTGIIREAHPTVPIIVVSPYFARDLPNNQTYAKQRRWVNAFVRKANAAGDPSIYRMDGWKLISKDTTYGLVDGIHCNTLGFYLFAKGLEPLLKRVLGSKGSPDF